jgi:hypothetical protein
MHFGWIMELQGRLDQRISSIKFRSFGPFAHITHLLFALATSGFAMDVALAQTPGMQHEVAAHVVVDFGDLARQERERPPAPALKRAIPSPKVTRRRAAVPKQFIQPETTSRLHVSLPAAQVSSPAAAATFEALADDDTAIPPGTMGAVSTNHLMVTLNTQIRIQNRSATALSTVSLNSFWASTGATGIYDPKLTFDPFNSRWIMAATSNADSDSSSILVGASQTSDPTGLWNLIRLDADAANELWADFPSLGFNKDWIVVSANMVTRTSNDFSNTRLFVVRKSNLFAGTAPPVTVFNSAAFTQVPAVTYSNSLASVYLVEDFNGNSGGSGFLGISTISGAVGSEVYTDLTAQPSTPNPWGFGPSGGADFAPQQGTASKIQNGDSRIQNVVYRNGSLWVAQNAFLPAASPTRTAAQWWQLQPTGTVQQFGRVDDPTGTIFYAYPSIAANSQSDVLLGFSVFSGSQFATAGYAFRAAGDAAGTLRNPAVLKAGEATYVKTFGGANNRWGDYSATVVDPANDLDFWTVQEYASSPDFPNGDDRWGTWWGKINSSATPVSPRRKGQTISE